MGGVAPCFKNKILKKMPREINIREYIKELGISIRQTKNYPLAYTTYDSMLGKYVIYYNPDNLQGETLEWALEHELLHIYRNDLTRVTKENLDAVLYNVASDYVINSIIPPVGSIADIVISKKNSLCPCDLDYRRGAMSIYEHFMQHRQQASFNWQLPGGGGGDCYNPVAPEDTEQAEKEAKRIQDKILQDYKNGQTPVSFDKSLDEMLKQLENRTVGQRRAGVGKEGFFTVQYPYSPLANKIRHLVLREVSTQEGNSEFWRLQRLHRHSRTEGVAREIEVMETRKILFIIDVSGSMDKFLPQIIGAISALEKDDVVVEKIFFSDNLYWTTRRDYQVSLGGTEFLPVLRFLQNKFYELIVLFTDYEFFDISPQEAVKRLRESCKKVILFNENLDVVNENDL